MKLIFVFTVLLILGCSTSPVLHSYVALGDNSNNPSIGYTEKLVEDRTYAIEYSHMGTEEEALSLAKVRAGELCASGYVVRQSDTGEQIEVHKKAPILSFAELLVTCER